MNILFFVDIMLQNEHILYLSILTVMIIGFLIFKKLNIKGLYILALFIAAKFAVHEYIDSYIDDKRHLEDIKHHHIILVTILISLMISLPAIIISKRVGLAEE